ncbi:FAD-dependent oxidoreductase [candidate division KSB1 bacterium]|nr:FAD-dependent oxidoreductase [candidate division KSB1 bacterium]
MKVVIVGGVAGGASAAVRLRRLDEKAEIILFEKGQYVSFANCGLPYYIGNVIQERENLLVQTPEKLKARFNLDVRIKSEVTKIDREKKQVHVKDLTNNNVYKESYDKLVLSPGAEPIRPNLKNVNSSKVFTIRNIPDTDAVKKFLDEKSPRHAVIVGGGYIGLEMAENLHHRNIRISVVEMADQVMTPIDFEMAALVHQHMKVKNIEFYLGDGLKEFEENGDKIISVLQSGRRLEADLVILSIGVRPEVQLAKDAELEVKRGIIVNNRLETCDPDIYAIGDAIEVKDFVNNENATIPLAGPANKQGRIVADVICGRDSKFNGTQGTSIVKVFDLTVAATGNNEKLLKKYNIPYIASIIHSASHAGYFPNAIPMAIKILFSPDGTLLGAQIVGIDGVDKRIDVLATAIRHHLTVYDLEDLELAYAPPYSSAKDPVNHAGYVGANILRGDVQIVHWHEIEALKKEGAFLLDVRDVEENAIDTIEGSVNIPVNQLRSNLDKLPKDKKIIIYCQIGLRGYIAWRILHQHGFKNIHNLSGGFKTYNFATMKQSNEDIFERDYIETSDLIKLSVIEDPKLAAEMAVKIDACGMQCPGPIMKLSDKMKAMQTGEIVEISATDPGFANDIKSWTRNTGNKLIDVKSDQGIIKALIQKGLPKAETAYPSGTTQLPDDKTIVVFSNDLDKVIAGFIIANGALSMGKKVTMFFTFWGLSVLRKKNPPRVKKTLIEKSFSKMLPKGVSDLTLSKMNMAGIGTKMMKSIMEAKNISSVENLIQSALDSGVKIIACQMSMDVMGIKQEELIDGIEVGGVATYLDASDSANMNLFI